MHWLALCWRKRGRGVHRSRHCNWPVKGTTYLVLLLWNMELRNFVSPYINISSFVFCKSKWYFIKQHHIKSIKCCRSTSLIRGTKPCVLSLSIFHHCYFWISILKSSCLGHEVSSDNKRTGEYNNNTINPVGLSPSLSISWKHFKQCMLQKANTTISNCFLQLTRNNFLRNAWYMDQWFITITITIIIKLCSFQSNVVSVRWKQNFCILCDKVENSFTREREENNKIFQDEIWR